MSADLPNVDDLSPSFLSVEQKIIKENVDYKQVTFDVRGRNIPKASEIKVTTTKKDRLSECDDLNFNYNISEKQNSDSKWAHYVLTVPKSVNGFVYFCLPKFIKNNAGRNTMIFDNNFKWIHQGADIKIDFSQESQQEE